MLHVFEGEALLRPFLLKERSDLPPFLLNVFPLTTFHRAEGIIKLGIGDLDSVLF